MDISAQDNEGRQPAHVAARGGHLEVVNLLVELKVDISVQDNKGRQPIHEAAWGGHLGVVDRLVELKVDTSAQDNGGWQPIHEAAWGGHLEVVDRLIELKVDVSARDNRGRQPIHVAAWGGHLGVVDRLIELKVDISARDNRGRQPIHMAAEGGHLGMINRLVELKVDVSAQDNEGWQPIHAAARDGHLEIVDRLIELKADISARMKDGWRPIHSAAQGGHLEAINRLVELRADASAQDNKGWQPIHLTAQGGHLEMVNRLIELKVDVSARTNLGRKPIHMASQCGHLEVVKRLLELEVIASPRTDWGRTIHMSARDLDCFNMSTVMLAVEFPNISLLEILIDANVGLDTTDCKGWTALHHAASCENWAACSVLITRGAEVNAQTRTGQTPLMMAGNSADLSGFKLLLKLGADPLVRDVCGYNVFDYFRHSSHPAWNLLERWTTQHQPLPKQERILSLQKCTRNLLQNIPSAIPVDAAGRELLKQDLSDLGVCFLGLENYEATRICFEQLVERSSSSEPIPRYNCDKCKKSRVVGSYWACKSCIFRGICSDCFRARSSGTAVFNCDADHEYLEIPGKDWKIAGKGEVNAEHLTLGDWIANQKQAYGIVSDGPSK
jgi:ankyrin repeat protein